MGNLTTLQKKLKAFRLSQNYKIQSEFADKLQVSQATIANMESGKREVSRPMLAKIYDVFHIDLISWNEEPVSKNKVLPNNIVAIPFYNAKAAAGAGELAPEYEEMECMYFDKRWLENIIGTNPRNLSIVQASGDSMYPLINDGDLLLVDNTQTTGNGVFVFKNDDLLRVKRLEKDFNGNLKISSENPKYENQYITARQQDENIEILGKVIWNGSKENV